jgi:hypothetical protein
MEDIDYAIYNYINDELNIFATKNTGFRKVPVIFSVPERAYQIKNERDIRSGSPNKSGGRTLEYPLISILRTSVNRNPQNKGRYGVYVPPYYDYYMKGGSIEIARQVQQDKTKNFANANSIRKSATKTDKNFQTFPGNNEDIVYETLLIPMPTFVEVNYTIGIVCNYQQQMNEVVAPFATRSSTPSVFTVTHEGNKYEAFMEPDFALDSNMAGLDVAERIFKTNITIKVLGYLVAAETNQETPVVVKRESAVKVTIGRERSVVGDIPDFHFGKKEKYRP